MNLMGQFEREGAALVWRRGTAGCAARAEGGGGSALRSTGAR